MYTIKVPCKDIAAVRVAKAFGNETEGATYGGFFRTSTGYAVTINADSYVYCRLKSRLKKGGK